MKRKAIIGTLISLVFLWLALRKVDFEQLVGVVKGAKWEWLIPNIILVVGVMWLRAWRWQLILKPVGKVPYRRVYSSTMIGFMVNNVLPARLGADDQTQLLRGNVVPVAVEGQRGPVVLRGLTTDGDQINVRRIADRAVRGVKMIGDLFIGTLNNEDGRSALKQKLTEFLLQMQKEGAIVPSTDAPPDPAFHVGIEAAKRLTLGEHRCHDAGALIARPGPRGSMPQACRAGRGRFGEPGTDGLKQGGSVFIARQPRGGDAPTLGIAQRQEQPLSAGEISRSRDH